MRRTMTTSLVEERDLQTVFDLGEITRPKPYLLAKRTLDLAAGLSGLVILSPIMLMVGLTIKGFSPGPVFFRQKRVGHLGKEFYVLKFRTMHLTRRRPGRELALEQQAFVKQKDDPRVFAFGKALRRLSLDELPQLFNILWGHMSLAGPRPLVPEEMSLCSPSQLRRLAAKPGLTGWAQINGRTDVSFDELMEKDLFYVLNASLSLDLKILLRTARVVLTRQGAY